MYAPVRIEPVEPTLPPREGGGVEPQDIEQQLESAILRLGYANRMNIDFLLNHPDEQITEDLELPSDDEIVRNVIGKQEETDADLIDMDSVIVEPEVIRPRAVFASLRVLEQYMKQQSSSIDALKAGKVRAGFSVVREAVEVQLRNTRKQTSILNYFAPSTSAT